MECQCASIRPGISVLPPASITVALAGASIDLAIFKILLPSISTLIPSASFSFWPSKMCALTMRTPDADFGILFILLPHFFNYPMASPTYRTNFVRCSTMSFNSFFKIGWRGRSLGLAFACRIRACYFRCHCHTRCQGMTVIPICWSQEALAGCMRARMCMRESQHR